MTSLKKYYQCTGPAGPSVTTGNNIPQETFPVRFITSGPYRTFSRRWVCECEFVAGPVVIKAAEIWTCGGSRKTFELSW